MNTKTRIRRTNKEIEETLFKSAEELIVKYGFMSLTMKTLYERSGIEHSMFYKRYRDLNDFLSVFVRNYDYWLNDSIEFDTKKNPIVNAGDILAKLVDALLDNPLMQKLLIWEMTENNYITHRTAQSRDLYSSYLIDYFTEKFKNCGLHYNYACSVIIGGIYYLILHREASTTNNIDFTKEESIDKLKLTIKDMISRLFSEPKNNERGEAIRIAEELIKSKVDYSIIKQSTKLDDKVLKGLIEKLK